MKYKKLLSVLLALVLVLSLAPTAAFAYDGGVGQPIRDNVHVVGVKKTWLYADGQEIPADELAALIDQGVIPESVDIFYVLLSSDDTQRGFAIGDKYHDAVDAYIREHWDEWREARPSWYINYDEPYESGMYGYDIHSLLEIFDFSAGMWIEELEELGWNADGWFQHEGNSWLNEYDLLYDDDGNFSQDSYINPDDIGGWSKQTLSQDNNWRFGVCPVLPWEDSSPNYVVESSDSVYDKTVQDFGPYTRRYNLYLNSAADYFFTPVREFLPEGYPLVSMSQRTEPDGDWQDWYYEEFFRSHDNYHYTAGNEAIKQMWDEAGEVLGEVSYSPAWGGDRIVVSRKEYDGRYFYKKYDKSSYSGGTSERASYYLDEGVTFTNTYSGERPWKDISVSKTWEGGSAASRPQSITVNLLANGEKVASKTVRAADDWTCTFTDMPVYSNGEEIVYTVTEDAVDDYETTIKEVEPGVWKVTNKKKTNFDDPTNPPAPDPDDPRPDLNTKDHYAYIIGYPDGLVRPNGTITRAETVTIFFRMLTDASRDAVWSTDNSFTDVKAADWFNNAISTMENGGIINGYPDGSFNPNGNITRAEFAAMAIRFFQDAKVGPSKFSDTIGHWAEEAINKALEQGLITGYPDGTFRPDQPITRAEAMTIVNRVLKRAPHKDHLLPERDMIVWPDNMDKTVWYYADVQEATNSHEYTMSGEYENWERELPVRDWVAFEKMWSNAHSASNPGEVIGD